MSCLRISLFGKMQLTVDNHDLIAFERGKVQELFCYLLTHRNRHHPREFLASLLWCDCSTARSKKYLRHVLWQLRSVLEALDPDARAILEVDTHWVSLDTNSHLELDVAIFEDAFEAIQKCKEPELSPELAQKLQNAIALYKGDLLDDLYQDWCLFERERLQSMYLGMLSRLLHFCESQAQYQEGVVHGMTILKYDNTNERAHRDVMRLQYLGGDRTGALRQYEKCAAVLAQELEIKPSQRTTELYNQIKSDRYEKSMNGSASKSRRQTISENVSALMNHLAEAQSLLVRLQTQMGEDMVAIETALRDKA